MLILLYKQDQKLEHQKMQHLKSKMTIQTQNNSLNYLIDPTFTKGNRLFVLPFGNETD